MWLATSWYYCTYVLTSLCPCSVNHTREILTSSEFNPLNSSLFVFNPKETKGTREYLVYFPCLELPRCTHVGRASPTVS